MKGYIDLYILPLPKKNLSAYRRIAQRFGKIIEDHGALEYREWVGDDLKVKGMGAFPSKIKLKPGEVLISSIVEFRSKSHRNQVNKKAMNDPRMKALMAEKPLFDMKRMLYGGFSTIVKMGISTDQSGR
ncbi:MAG TPA: DUF1428 domain-containing protein [Thermodesulfobacteriota bacterium]|nr:DUF1428 domain-containing protein [Thermodesulfobacteriota bacterium]